MEKMFQLSLTIKLALITGFVFMFGCANQNSNFTKSSETLFIHHIESRFLSKPTEIQVLTPDDLDYRKKYRVLYLLPVHQGHQPQALQEVKRLDIANKYNVICVGPDYDAMPWYANHPTNERNRQESYFLKDVIPLIDKNYPTIKSPEGRFLIGFSKSGWGAFSLLLRHPDMFCRAAAWDAPLAKDKPDRWGMAENFGTEQNFKKYNILLLLKKRAEMLKKQPIRLYLSGFGVHGQSTIETHQRMQELGIPHYYDFSTKRKHKWESGWLEGLIDQLLKP